jgi:hypothetical protein
VVREADGVADARAAGVAVGPTTLSATRIAAHCAAHRAGHVLLDVGVERVAAVHVHARLRCAAAAPRGRQVGNKGLPQRGRVADEQRQRAAWPPKGGQLVLRWAAGRVVQQLHGEGVHNVQARRGQVLAQPLLQLGHLMASVRG